MSDLATHQYTVEIVPKLRSIFLLQWNPSDNENELFQKDFWYKKVWLETLIFYCRKIWID